MQWLSAKVEGKAQKYSRIGALTMVLMHGKECHFEKMKGKCHQHIKMIEDVHKCDIFAGEGGLSFSSVSQITDQRVLNIRFVEAGTEKSPKNRKIGHHCRSRGESGISSTSSFIDFSITRPLRPPSAKKSTRQEQV